MNRSHVSSTRNPLLKEYLKLLNSRRYRQQTKQIALEGPNLVKEALEAGLEPRAIFYTDDYFALEGKKWLPTLPSSAKQLLITPALFRKIADTETPQEVAAIFPTPEEGSGQKKPVRPDLVLILYRLQDPGNLGSILRTAAAAGADTVYYITGTVDPYNPKVLRATAGTIFRLPLEQVDDPGTLIRSLKEKGVQVAAGLSESSLSFWSVDYRKPTALIVGNEAGGVSADIIEEADICVSIPQAKNVESLNVAVAAALIMYEIVRQRSFS